MFDGSLATEPTAEHEKATQKCFDPEFVMVVLPVKIQRTNAECFSLITWPVSFGL